MKHHFDALRLAQEKLDDRDDAGWEYEEQSQEHRVAVLRALQEAMHDTLVARYVDTTATGVYADDDPEFLREFWDQVWEGLRDSLTRQDLLRWLIDWAHHSAQERALGTVERMKGELELLDDDSGAWWLTQKRGG